MHEDEFAPTLVLSRQHDHEMRGTLRIGLVDDHPVLLHGLTSLIRDWEGTEVVATGRSAEDIVAIASNQSPSVLIVDLSMPGDVLSAIREVREVSPGTPVVVFTAYANVDLARQSIDAGARAFVLKGRPFSDLFDAVASVRAGNMFISPDFAPKLVAATRRSEEEDDEGPVLTSREREISYLLLEAKTNKEIAKALSLSEKTIKHYLTNLMAKLGVRSRLEAALALKAMKRAQNPLTAK